MRKLFRLMMDLLSLSRNVPSSVIIRTNHDSHREFDFPTLSRRVILRFGAKKKIKKRGIEFNSPKAIKKCENKIIAKTIFKKKGVSSPSFSLIPFNSLCVMKKVNGSRGSGMRLITTPNDIPKSYTGFYFERKVRCDIEFRVHVIGKRIFHIDKKVLRRGRTQEHWIKNMGNGYCYRERDTARLHGRARKDCIKAVKCLGLVFGAVDIGINSKSGQHYVFEVNSAPGLRTVTRQKYREAILTYLKQIYKIKEI